MRISFFGHLENGSSGNTIRKMHLIVFILLYILVSNVTVSMSQTVWEHHTHYPVLDCGPDGSWDAYWVEPISVVHDGEKFKMWYMGLNDQYTSGIGLAESVDGISWDKNSANPVLTKGKPGSWDEGNIYHGCVLIIDDVYHFWFHGWNNDGSIYGIGLATSTDGIIWTEHAENPIFVPDGTSTWDQYYTCADPSVVFDGETYHMWYQGTNNEYVQNPQRILWKIGYATSPDGIHWTPYANNPVLINGPRNSWDWWKVEMPSVIKEGSDFQMWFHGDNAKSQIGYACSPDGINWTKCADNPVLSPVTIGSWYLIGLMEPLVLYIEETSTYHLWYSGGAFVGNDVTSKIGYATSLKTAVRNLDPVGQQVIDHFSLIGNYPNPFNPVTTISYQLPEAAHVTLSIYNMAGQLVTELVNGFQPAGVHNIDWNAKSLSSGMYVYELKAGDFSVAKKCILMQ